MLASKLKGKVVVVVVGIGTIGEPLAILLLSYLKHLGIDYVVFTKNTPKDRDIPAVEGLIRKGGIFAASLEKIKDFAKIGPRPAIATEDVWDTATVIIDCTPKKVGRANKQSVYQNLKEAKGFIAQGSEQGFGKPYAFRIADSALNREDRFIWVLSCNTHALSAATWTIAFDQGTKGPENLIRGSFTLLRRASDISQDKSIPAIEMGELGNPVYGTHQAEDCANLFRSTFGWEINVFSQAYVLNNQYMHSTAFQLNLAEDISREEILRRIRRNPLIALTKKMQSNQVFSFGRDHGHCGRILNQLVIGEKTIGVYGNRVVGESLTPQDGNSLLSSTAATLYLLDPKSYMKRMQKFLGPRFVFPTV